MESAVLLHLCAPATWRLALAAGSVAPPSLLREGFVHLSAPGQVKIPANAIYAGRTDLVALVVDPARLPHELRYEPAVDGSSPGVVFPHHYGPVPVGSVVAVLPYPPGPDGRFTDPAAPPAPDDVTARVRLFDRALAQRCAAAVRPVTGGVALLDPRFPASEEHNTVWLSGPCDAATVAAETSTVLGATARRRVVLDDRATAGALDDLGWAVAARHLMAWNPATRATCSRDVVPVAGDESLADAVLRVVHFALLDDQREPIAAARLHVDGATAAIRPAQPTDRTAPLVRHCVAHAQAIGCDVVFVSAADDDQRDRYAALGFCRVATRYEATRQR